MLMSLIIYTLHVLCTYFNVCDCPESEMKLFQLFLFIKLLEKILTKIIVILCFFVNVMPSDFKED